LVLFLTSYFQTCRGKACFSSFKKFPHLKFMLVYHPRCSANLHPSD
jgi:hypothetical protein